MKPIAPPLASFEAADPKNTRDQNGRFISGVGNGGSRGGRPRGARSKFTEQFFVDIRDAWERDGPAVISRAFFQDPVASLKAIAGLMPREAKLEISQPTDGLSEEQFDRLIAYAEAQVAKAQSVVIDGEATEVPNEQLASPDQGSLITDSPANRRDTK